MRVLISNHLTLTEFLLQFRHNEGLDIQSRLISIALCAHYWEQDAINEDYQFELIERLAKNKQGFDFVDFTCYSELAKDVLKNRKEYTNMYGN